MGQVLCTEVSLDVGINHHYLGVNEMGGGAAFFDFNNDSYEDLWISGGVNMDAFYKNNGDGTFSNISLEAGLAATNFFVTTGVVSGDVNNDGFRDVLVLTHRSHRLLLFINNGDQTFSEESLMRGLGGVTAQNFAAAFSDVNLDGHLDIYVGNYLNKGDLIYEGNEVTGFDYECHPNWFFLNQGDGTFSQKAAEFGIDDNGCALAVIFTDYDMDSDPDLLVANDFGEWVTPNGLFENDFPADTLPNIGASSGMDVGIYGMGIAVGDYDRDLDLDYYITNLGRNVFLENQNDGTFLDNSSFTGTEDTYMDSDSLFATGWGTAFIDLDNDADLDLFVCNGFIPSADFIANNKVNKNRLFINDGNEAGVGYSFSEFALGTGLDDGGRGRGFAYSDYDNDGDLDLIIINNNRQATPDSIHGVLLYRNDLETNGNWLKVSLEGVKNNRDAFGATIKIVVGNMKWVHDYNGGFGTHASQSSSIAHFGLGEHGKVDSLIVTWPGGAKSYFSNISSNQAVHIKEEQIVSSQDQQLIPRKFSFKVYPNPFVEELNIQFRLEKSEAVNIEVFDVLGRKIDTIFDNWYSSGEHNLLWSPPSSILSKSYFFIRLRTESQTITQRVITVF